MSLISPGRLRRVASSSSAESATTVDPSSIFGYDPWVGSSGSKQLVSPPSSASLAPERTAGSDVYALKRSTSNAKRLHVDSFHGEPETPLRKVRGQSVSGFSQSGLVTPQSVNRSFSTSSLTSSSLTVPYTPGGMSLPSPRDTPLATPLNSSLDNPFDGFYESKLWNSWHFGVDPPVVPASQSTSSLLMQPAMTRSPSASSLYSKSDDDYTPISSVGSMSSMAAKSSGVNGVNPFYCPPAFLRRQSSVSDYKASMNISSISEIGHMHHNYQHHPHGPEFDDAGVSPKDVGDDEADEHCLDHHRLGEHFGAGLSQEGDATFYTGAFPGAEPTDYELFQFPQVPEVPTSNMPGSPPARQDKHSQSGRRSRSSSTVSCASTDVEKPFVCTSCSKAFRRMEHLRRHQKTHTLERPFACTVQNCGRRFSRTDNLKAHILTHTKKSGRNIYVEGLAEMQEIKPIKRRRSRKGETQIAV